jgi:TRAP-type C4-dicarboxylate transport system substrate-binding protein
MTRQRNTLHPPFLWVPVVGVLLVALALLWPAPSDAAVTLKCATATINDVQHEWCKRYIARLEKSTNGFIKGQVFPASQLGSIPRMLEGVQLGTIETFITPPDFLIGLDPRFMALTAPYLFDSIDHAHRVLNDREFLDKFLALAEPKGITGVSLLVYGPAGIASRTPVHAPDDLRGKKLRINATPIERMVMAAFGATGVPMAPAELITALQQGAVDGVQSGLPIMVNFKFYEAAKYHANTHHYFVTSIAIINKKWLDGLPPEVRRAVLEEGRAVHAELLEVTKQANASAEATWKSATKDGWIELTAEQRATFRSRLEGIDARIAQEQPAVKELVDLLRKKSRELR